MANPAELLFNQFTEWNDSKNSAYRSRSDNDELAIHRRAVQNLNDIRHVLVSMQNDGKRVGVYQRAFPGWAKVIFNYPNCWGDSSTGKIEQKVMDDLENLIDAMDPYVAKLDTEGFEAFLKYLDEIEAVLEEDDSLNSLAKDGARLAVRNVRDAFQNFSQVGDFQTEEALKSLLAQIALLLAQSKKKQTWQDLLNKWVFPYVVNQFPQLPAGELFSALAPGSGS